MRTLMARGVFVTGTDTGIGKSIVSATLARLMRKAGVNVGVMKPVTSGCIERDGALVSLDAELLCYGAQIPFHPDCAPYLLEAPLAPSAAAELEGVRIDLEVIRQKYLQLTERYDFVIVEGAGGLMVPVCGSTLMADLAAHLDLPLIVVARPNLGTVNHTLLTTFAARQLGLAVTGVVVNRYPKAPDQAEETGLPLIASLCGAALLGVFPEVAGVDDREVVERVLSELPQDVAERVVEALLATQAGRAADLPALEANRGPA